MSRTTWTTLGLILALAAGARGQDDPAKPARIRAKRDEVTAKRDEVAMPSVDVAADRLLRRAAYYETQKGDGAAARKIYEEIAAKHGGTPAALQALERIAVLQERAGDLKAAESARTAAAALRAKLDLTREPEERTTDGRATEAPAPTGLPPEAFAQIRKWLAEGLTRDEIRDRLRKRLTEGLQQPPRKGDGIPPALRALVLKMKAEGRSRDEIKEALQKHVGEQLRGFLDGRRSGVTPEPPTPPPAPSDPRKPGPKLRRKI